MTQRPVFIFLVEEHSINSLLVELKPFLHSLGPRTLDHGPGRNKLAVEGSSFHQLGISEVIGPNNEMTPVKNGFASNSQWQWSLMTSSPTFADIVRKGFLANLKRYVF